MKQITSNTLATLVLVGIMSLSSMDVSGLSKEKDSTENQLLKRLDRVYQHHDRKHELRASVLGISSEELRAQLKARPLDTIIKKHGFKNRLGFYTAVTGKLKDELRRRGWSERKIEEYVQKRLARLTPNLQNPLVFSV